MNLANLKGNLVMRHGIWYSQDNAVVSYPETGNEECYQLEDTSFWFKHRNTSIINLAKRFSPNEAFWDIGGGNGFVSLGLQQNGFDVVLIEPGIYGCQNAKSRGLRNIICSTLENIALDESSVPSCGIFDVVEHIKDDQNFLKNIHSVLKFSGFLYVTVPAYQMLWSDEDVAAGHYRRYTIKSMSRLLIDVGFKIKYSTYLFSMLPLPIFLFRTIPSKLKGNKRHRNLIKHKQEHSNVFLLNKLLACESGRINHLNEIPFGSSCLIVAQK